MKDTLEQLLIRRRQLLERMVDPDIHAPPIIPSARLAVPVVLSYHRELRVERDTHPRVAWQLERRPVVERPHHYPHAARTWASRPIQRHHST